MRKQRQIRLTFCKLQPYPTDHKLENFQIEKLENFQYFSMEKLGIVSVGLRHTENQDEKIFKFRPG